jgi:hypothetical protein
MNDDDPQLDPPIVERRGEPRPDPVFDSTEFLRRLVNRYQPGHWIGGLRRAFGPVAELGEGSSFGELDTHPAHYLVALWRPLDASTPFLPRWPAKVSIVTPDAQTAARELLADMPRRQRMWVAGPEIDWAIIARIVILGEPRLRPYQHRELEAFIRTEQRAALAAISVRYSGPDKTFEQFSNTVSDADES